MSSNEKLDRYLLGLLGFFILDIISITAIFTAFFLLFPWVVAAIILAFFTPIYPSPVLHLYLLCRGISARKLLDSEKIRSFTSSLSKVFRYTHSLSLISLIVLIMLLYALYSGATFTLLGLILITAYILIRNAAESTFLNCLSSHLKQILNELEVGERIGNTTELENKTNQTTTKPIIEYIGFPLAENIRIFLYLEDDFNYRIRCISFEPGTQYHHYRVDKDAPIAFPLEVTNSNRKIKKFRENLMSYTACSTDKTITLAWLSHSRNKVVIMTIKKEEGKITKSDEELHELKLENAPDHTEITYFSLSKDHKRAILILRNFSLFKTQDHICLFKQENEGFVFQETLFHYEYINRSYIKQENEGFVFQETLFHYEYINRSYTIHKIHPLGDTLYYEYINRSYTIHKIHPLGDTLYFGNKKEPKIVWLSECDPKKMVLALSGQNFNPNAITTLKDIEKKGNTYYVISDTGNNEKPSPSRGSHRFGLLPKRLLRPSETIKSYDSYAQPDVKDDAKETFSATPNLLLQSCMKYWSAIKEGLKAHSLIETEDGGSPIEIDSSPIASVILEYQLGYHYAPFPNETKEVNHYVNRRAINYE